MTHGLQRSSMTMSSLFSASSNLLMRTQMTRKGALRTRYYVVSCHMMWATVTLREDRHYVEKRKQKRSTHPQVKAYMTLTQSYYSALGFSFGTPSPERESVSETAGRVIGHDGIRTLTLSSRAQLQRP